MEIKIFYSWQSDLPSDTNSEFIEKALINTAKSIQADHSIKVEPVIDRDSAGISGSPSIPQAILQKIDECDVFIGDVSIINFNSKFRPTPNPNVLFELGYALKKLDWAHILLIMNEAFGKVEKLPFDLEKRRAITYHLSKASEEKTAVQSDLEKRLRVAIKSIVDIKLIEATKKLHSEDLITTDLKRFEINQRREHLMTSAEGLSLVKNEVEDLFSALQNEFNSRKESFERQEVSLKKENDSSFTIMKGNAWKRPRVSIQWQVGNDLSSLESYNLFLGFLQDRISFYQGDFRLVDKKIFHPKFNENLEIVWQETGKSAITSKEIIRDAFQMLLYYLQNPPEDEAP